MAEQASEHRKAGNTRKVIKLTAEQSFYILFAMLVASGLLLLPALLPGK